MINITPRSLQYAHFYPEPDLTWQYLVLSIYNSLTLTIKKMHRYYKSISTAYHTGISEQLNITSNYSTKATFKLTKQAAAQHANDGKGSHTHVGTQKCTIADCDNKKCPSVCGQPTSLSVDGHNTHKPPVGRMARFIADTDAKGNPEKQYFVPVNKPNEITEQAKQAFGKEFKPDPKTLNYVKQQEDKYD